MIAEEFERERFMLCPACRKVGFIDYLGKGRWKCRQCGIETEEDWE